MEEIKTNAELDPGKYYHCFQHGTGRHSIEQCMTNHSGFKMLSKFFFAEDDNNQALEKWKILGPIEVPNLETIYLCPAHHGHGFSSDCAICNLTP